MGMVRIAMPMLVTERVTNPLHHPRDSFPRFARRFLGVSNPRPRSNDNSAELGESLGDWRAVADSSEHAVDEQTVAGRLDSRQHSFD